jgi:hypothetical protein
LGAPEVRLYGTFISVLSHAGGDMRLDSLLSPQKMNNIFKSEVSFVLVAPSSWQDDGIVGQTNILSNLPFHVDHREAIY